MPKVEKKENKLVTDHSRLKRYGFPFAVLSPLVIAAGGILPADLAIILMIAVLASVGLIGYLLIQKFGFKGVRSKLQQSYTPGVKTSLFIPNLALAVLLSFVCWSSSFWGSRVSSALAAAFCSIPALSGMTSSWSARNIVILPLLAALSPVVLSAWNRLTGRHPEGRRSVGGLIRVIMCLTPGAMAVIPLFANPLDSLFLLIVYICLLWLAVVFLQLKYDVAPMFKTLWYGRKGNIKLPINILVLAVLLVPALLFGKDLNRIVLRGLDNLAQTKLAQGPVAAVNIPLYFVAGVQVLLSVLLLFSRLRLRAVVRGGVRGKARVQLQKQDGTIIYSSETGASRKASEEVADILLSAVRERASDIHLEPSADELQIRFRVDGLLKKRDNYPMSVGKPILSSVKVMANMDIAERRKPQDGRFSGVINNNVVDFRVSSSPTTYGENIVVRVLDQSEGLMRLDDLGFMPDQLQAWRSIVRRPQGIAIVCGPTGSGKTTSIYGTISQMDVEQKNVITIEEPIEYNLTGVTQTIISEKAHLTFATALRSTLRQDPDVIFVGEIRDAETAKIAMQASLTGHLVLTTVHATDVCSCLLRLMDLGVNDKNIISFSSILSQRLVRKLCQRCKTPETTSKYEAEIIGKYTKVPSELYKPAGCEECNHTGYRGRTGIFELLTVKDWIRDLFLREHSPGEIRRKLKDRGFKSIWNIGLEQVTKGLTTLDEIERVAVPED